MATVTLSGKSFALAKPRDTAAVWDCLALARRNANRASAMALAICWPDDQVGRPRVRYSECGYDPGEFGGRVFADLVERGAPAIDVITAGAAALRLVAESVPAKQDVASAEGFSGPDEGN